MNPDLAREYPFDWRGLFHRLKACLLPNFGRDGASFHKFNLLRLNLFDAPGEVDYRAVVDIAVAGAPQRIGLKVRLWRVAFPVFRLLVFLTLVHLQNATARCAVENPGRNRRHNELANSLRRMFAFSNRGQHFCWRVNNT